jgi:hypothetical protein
VFFEELQQKPGFSDSAKAIDGDYEQLVLGELVEIV